MKQIDVRQIEGQPAWIGYIKKRIKDNKNFLCMVVGPTGSGKSLTALSILEMLNDKFNIDMVVFNGKDLIKLINYGTYEKTKDNVIGFLWDEAGVELSNRNWQSITNKIINYLLQTFRHRNFVLIFTAPYMDFVDSSTRKLFHAVFETCGINKQKQTVTIKPKQIQYNADRKKFYYHYLKVSVEDNGVVKKKRWKIHRPTPEVEKLYERKKFAFTSELNKKIEKTFDSLDDDGRKRKPMTEIQKMVKKYRDQGVKPQEEIARLVTIERKEKTSQQTVSNALQSLLFKGY